MMKKMGNPLSDEEVRDIMKESGSSSSISYPSFCKLLGIGIKQSRETDPEEEMQDAFRLFDRDRDGVISAQEMKNALIMFGITLTDREVDQVRARTQPRPPDPRTRAYRCARAAKADDGASRAAAHRRGDALRPACGLI